MSEKSQPLTKNNIAYHKLKAMLLTNRLSAGQLISESALIAELKVGRSALRMAIQLLIKEGYLEAHNGSGTYVRSFSVQDLADLCEIRLALENLAAKTAVLQVAAADADALLGQWRELRRRLTRQTTIIEQSLLQQIEALDHATHQLLVAASANQMIQPMYEELRQKISWLQSIFPADTQQRLERADANIRLLEALRDGDAEAVIAANSSRINVLLQDIVDNRAFDIAHIPLWTEIEEHLADRVK